MLATGNEDGTISLYTRAGHAVARRAGNGSVRSLAFSPKGRVLALMSGFYVRLLDTSDHGSEPRLVHRNEGSAGEWSASNVAWSLDGSRLAGRTLDGALRVWRADGTPLAVLDGCGEGIGVVSWSPDGRTLAGGSADRTVCLWSWR